MMRFVAARLGNLRCYCSGANKNDDAASKINDILKSMAEKQSSTVPSITIRTDDIGTRHRFARKEKRNLKPNPQRDIKNAASAIGEQIGERGPQVEAELLEKALNPVPSDYNWSELISGMEVDNAPEEFKEANTKAQQIKSALNKSGQYSLSAMDVTSFKRPSYRTQSRVQTVDLFGGTPLNIFNNEDDTRGTVLETWKELENHTLEMAVTHPPTNYFEKMIKWTKEGKIWRFPIDNEQGLTEEQSVHFSEHIFMENHIEDWCPKRGPIRHFMELVCVGLSKNPYLTVKDKIEHLAWYKEYFESEKELLISVGAWDNHDMAPVIPDTPPQLEESAKS